MRAKTVAFGSLAAVAFAGFVALGVWQMQRRSWKHALIERVDQRIHALPVEAPGPAAWPNLTAAQDEYRHVRVTGWFEGKATLVQAVTERGGGFWAMTPFRTEQHYVVLINRGFVASARPEGAEPAESATSAETSVTGLLRMTEPNGAFLRRNDPASDRWYSRDVAGIAAARGLGEVAPYFVDADAGPEADGSPVGGLTVVTFPDNHLLYALIWFSLALLVAGGSVYSARITERAPEGTGESGPAARGRPS